MFWSTPIYIYTVYIPMISPLIGKVNNNDLTSHDLSWEVEVGRSWRLKYGATCFLTKEVRELLSQGTVINNLSVFVDYIYAYICIFNMYTYIICIYLYVYIYIYIRLHTSIHYITLHYSTVHYITSHHITYIHTLSLCIYLHGIHMHMHIYIHLHIHHIYIHTLW